MAIIPAAGLSRRMGQPKLLLSLGGRPIIDRVVQTLLSAGITRVLVVVRAGDLPLIDVVTAAGGIVVAADPAPVDMRQSVELGLRELLSSGTGAAVWQGWLLIPADHPTLNMLSVQTILTRGQSSPDRIVIPTFQGRRGHPTLFPRDLARSVFSLPVDAGINQLVRAHVDRVLEIPLDDASILEDLDTPEDWDRIRSRWAASSAGSTR